MKPRVTGSLYDKDFFLWATETARLLREGKLDNVDIQNVAEGIEGLANRDRRELRSRLRLLVRLLLQWHCQPDRRSRSRKAIMLDERIAIERLLEDSPSLRRSVAPSLSRIYREAVAEAAAETSLPVPSFPRECPFTADQILDHDFLPGA